MQLQDTFHSITTTICIKNSKFTCLLLYTSILHIHSSIFKSMMQHQNLFHLSPDEVCKRRKIKHVWKQQQANFRFSPRASNKFSPQMTYTTNTECSAGYKEKKDSFIITMKLCREFNNPCVQSKFS